MDELVAYNCDPDTEYNEVASLFLRDADTAIRQVHFATNNTAVCCVCCVCGAPVCVLCVSVSVCVSVCLSVCTYFNIINVDVCTYDT